MVFDPRGMGALRSRKVNPNKCYEIYGTELKLNSDSVMSGTSLSALRVFDIIRACDYIRKINKNASINIAGKGTGAVYALLAAVIVEDVNKIYLENMINSFEQIILQKYYKYNCRLDIYGILKEFDIPLILKLLKDKDIKCINYTFSE